MQKYTRAVNLVLGELENAAKANPSFFTVTDLDDHYVGSYRFPALYNADDARGSFRACDVNGPFRPLIRDGALDFWRTKTDLESDPDDEDKDAELEDALAPEFATNMSKLGANEVKLVTSKFLGMRKLPGDAAVINTRDIDEKDAGKELDTYSYVDAYTVDFLYNVFRMKLRTADEIMRFVDNPLPANCMGYLLTEDEVDLLIANGFHEGFEDEELMKADALTRDILTFFNTMVVAGGGRGLGGGLGGEPKTTAAKPKPKRKRVTK
jgi:hypothetical protein